MSRSITCPTQDGTHTAKSVTRRAGRSPRWYGKTPASVSLDQSLSGRAVRVYSILALKTFQGNVSTLGLRQLALLIGVSRTTAQRAIAELVIGGHIKASAQKNGSRGWYELTSPVFAQKQRAGVDEVVYFNDRPRLVSVGRSA